MTTELVSYALLSVEEAEAYLNAGSEVDTEDLVNRATDYCEWYCNRPLAARPFTALRFAAQDERVLRMRGIPIDVDEDITIEIDGTTQTVWTKETDGDPADFDVIVGAKIVPGTLDHFYRHCGWRGGSVRNPYPVRISYTGGLATIPGQLRDAALLVLENIFRAQEHKVVEVASFTAGPVSPGVTFRPELIPMKAKQILEAYRVWH